MIPKPGRGVEIAGKREVKKLERGMDFRRIEHRRETFLRFYEFHLRYKTHPGLVYLLFPELARAGGWGAEERLWFAYINGNTQNPVTSWLIFRRFPDPKALRSPAEWARFKAWWADNAKRLAFDTDRRYFRTKFPTTVERYLKLLGGETQEAMFRAVASSADGQTNFRSLWDFCSKRYVYFGRLSVFSYLEYLRIMGVEVECDQLFLHDLDGSKSHRNGLAKVLGRDDLDWHDSNPDFGGQYDASLIDWFSTEAERLLEEQRTRLAATPLAKDVGYFTMESALCTFKSWHRPNRRYPNVYADMLVERIQKGERAWGEKLDVFWEARQRLPRALRLEDNPADPGVVPEKQNHYRETGEVIMMDLDWPCFRNAFNDRVAEAQR